MAAQMPPPPGAAPAADDSLARWVADLRQAGGPANRAVGAGPLRDASRARAASRPRGPELSAVEDLTAARDVRARLYRPARDPRPLTLYLHGGGFVVGDLESHDAICRRLAQTAGTAVLAVDYRRAPEYPGPAAVEDAVAVYEWALDHVRRSRRRPDQRRLSTRHRPQPARDRRWRREGLPSGRRPWLVGLPSRDRAARRALRGLDLDLPPCRAAATSRQ